MGPFWTIAISAVPDSDEQCVSSSVGIGIFLRRAFDTVENRSEFRSDTPVSRTPLSGLHLIGRPSKGMTDNSCRPSEF